MTFIIVIGAVIGWVTVAALSFVTMDAICGQPLLGKWWRRPPR